MAAMAHLLALLSVVTHTTAQVLSESCHPFNAQCCHIADSDPSYTSFKALPEKQIPGWLILDLDKPAEERWVDLVKPAAEGIKTMISHFKGFASIVSQELFKLFEDSASAKVMTDNVLDFLGEYGAEIRSIAKAVGMLEQDVLFYNMMYEIEGGIACTSIVAQDAKGNLVHGRNLDFGLLFGEDFRHLQWTLTEDLRPLLRNVRVMKGGQVIYNSTVFLGYNGMMTGAKLGGFSITINSRMTGGQGWPGLRDFLSGKDRSGSFLSLALREVMLNKATYSEALGAVNSMKLLGPAYVILGGIQPGEGAIVVRQDSTIVASFSMAEAVASGRNSIVQTNWDIPKDPIYDNRRAPAEHCLKERFNDAIDFPSMFAVLSAHPNRNRLTTYTALMSAQTGEFEAYYQYCNEPLCAPWLGKEADAAAAAAALVV